MTDGGEARPRNRRAHEPPPAAADHGWRYHHLGVPTQIARPRERYLARYRMYVAGFEISPYGIEWMRFEDGSPVHDLVKTVPHVAFEVSDLDAALEDKDVIAGPSSPSDGVRVAMIVDDGAPVELLEFRR